MTVSVLPRLAGVYFPSVCADTKMTWDDRPVDSRYSGKRVVVDPGAHHLRLEGISDRRPFLMDGWFCLKEGESRHLEIPPLRCYGGGR